MRTDTTRTPGTIGPLATALGGSAIVHASVIGEHYEEWAVAGTFFLGLLVAEMLLAVAAWRWWSRPVGIAIVLTGLLTIAVWVPSRTTGLPFGPDEFRSPEAVGAPDLACVVLELVSVVLAGRLLRRARLSSTRPRPRWAPALAPLPLVAITLLGLTPAVAGAPHQHGHEVAERAIPLQTR